MTANLQKIIKALAKELTEEVTKKVTQQLRESYEGDVTAIVKECLRNNEIIQDSGLGYLTRNVICEKYNVSQRTLSEKIKLFQIERKKAGRNKLVNEKQFLDSLQRPVERPKFLKDRKAA